MITASKECKCSSCGDDISIGAKITIKTHADKPTEILCFRCNPESETTKIKVSISSKTLPQHRYKSAAKDKRFFAKAQ